MTKTFSWWTVMFGCLLMGLSGCSQSSATSSAGLNEPQPGVKAQTAPSETDTEETVETVDPELELDEPASYKPLVAAAVLRPSKVPASGTLTLTIRAKTAPGWHIYAAGQQVGSSLPTRLELELPDGVEAAGDWIYPQAAENHVGGDGQLIYEGEFTFQQRLKVGPETPLGAIKVGCEIYYQACDPFSCRPPESLKLEAAAEVVQKP